MTASRPGNRPPRVAAAHAFCGFGKNALGIALPVLSACGVEVYPFPTAILSANPSFPGHTFLDMTDSAPDWIRHWSRLDLLPDAVYTGFPGSPAMALLLVRLAREIKAPFLAVDPVLGDHGRPYAITTPGHIAAMRELAASADLLMPNPTEACLLTGMDPARLDPSPEEIEALCRRLAGSKGASVVMTGVVRDGSPDLYNCVLEGGSYAEYATPRLPLSRFGTGDLFASVLVASLVTGFSLGQGVVRASRFVSAALTVSADLPDSQRRGVCFEPVLDLLRREFSFVPEKTGETK